MGGSDDDKKEHHRHALNVSHKATLISVSSLFAFTLLVIIFFLYIKYRQNRRRDRRRTDFISRLVSAQISPSDSVIHNTNHVPKSTTRGLDPQVIDSLPEFVYKSSSAAAANGRRGSRGGSIDVVECSVCLSSITDDSKVRLLPNCKHLFHVECVDMWLSSNTTCPLCRAAVEPKVPTAEPEESSAVERVVVQPSAPPVDELSLLHGEEDLNKASGSGSSGPLRSSFRRILSREKSSRSRSSLGGCSELAAVVDHHDLERQ
ncbi:RING-H2 finger protein ATL40-like [Humulus lupulus]|uniref:RING-H2 finger protein ATL40-like n=1 Tax=Humulus lupulus TaxID=3486 RepID=UPI002B4093F1|nr:RING-H2 finger protein ATL40-like [Humulus lupulus]